MFACINHEITLGICHVLHVVPGGASAAAGGDEMVGITDTGATSTRPAEALEGEGRRPPRMAPFADLNFRRCIDGGEG